MKLVVAGNLVNNGYQIVKFLRKYGLNADLLTNKNSSLVNDPKFFDKNLDCYPQWIRFWNGSKRNWPLKIIKIMREYDVVSASSELPIFALFSRKPFVVLTTGSDVTELAHKNTIKGLLLRLAYKKANIVIFLAPFMYPSIIKLKIKRSLFLPIAWDYTKFHPEEKQTNQNGKFTIFHPSSHIWKVKGNNKFLKAFVKLCKEHDDVHLILIKRGIDFEKSLKILDTPQSKGKYTIIPQSLDQNKLPEFYNQADVVVDSFILGTTGLIGQEAMSCEKPLIQAVDKNLYEKFYDEIPPIINAQNEHEGYTALKHLIENKTLAKEIGKKSRKWLLKYHDPQKIIKKYIYVYNAVNEKKDFQTIKDELSSIS